ncbi:unnamed protein product [Lampetra planeri]
MRMELRVSSRLEAAWRQEMRSRLASCLLLLLGGGVFTTLSWRAAADVSRATRLEWVRQGAGSDALLRAGTRDEDLAGVTQFEWQSLSPPDAYTIVASWEPTRPDDAELSQMFGGRAKPFANGSLQIRALQQSDSGAFNVAVKRGMKVTNTNINLTVYGPLAASVNVSKPGPLKANSDNVSLACEANSTDGVTFAWRRNGVELTRRDPLGYSLSEDGRLLTVTPVLPGDDHSLTCSASNPFFSSQSPAADIDVHGPLAASVNVSKPGPLKANSDNVSLACEANSTDGVTFTWRRNGVELTRRDPLGYSLSEDGRLLTVTPVLPGDDHSLTCSASNPFFSARSPAADIDVHGPLEVSVDVSWPGPLKADSDHVTLACVANATRGVAVAWLRSGKLLDSSDSSRASLSRDQARLSLAPVTAGDNGTITCHASNAFYNVSSQAALLDVHGPLEVSVDVSWPGPLKADSDNVTLACVANATRGVAVAWLRSGKLLDSSDSSRASLSRDQARLTLAPVTAGDNGTITCHASNAFYNASSQAALLDVHEAVSKPTFMLTPATAVEGKDTVGGRCGCKSAGNGGCGGGGAGPAPRVSWLRGGREFSPGERRGSEMTMGPVRREDRGSYGCRISNAVSVESSDPQALVVIWLYLLPGKPVATTALNHEGNLSCTANASPTPKFSWFRDGTPVGPAKEASDGTLCTSTLLVAGGTDSLLGEYTCVATNEVGSRNRTIVVTDAKLSSFTVFLDAHKRWALLRWTLKRWGCDDNGGGDWGALTAVVVQRNASSAPLGRAPLGRAPLGRAPLGRAAPAAWTLVARVPPAAQGTHNDSQLAGATAPAYRLLLEFGDVTQEEESAIAGLRVTCLDPEGADCAAHSTPPRDKVAETGMVVGSVLAVSLVVIGLLAIVCFRKRKLPGQFDAKAAARRPHVYAGDVVPKQTSPTTTECDILSALPPNTAPHDSDGGGDEVVVANVIDRRDGLAELWEEEEEEMVRENGHYVSYDTCRSSVPQQQQPPSQLHEPGHHDELEVMETNHDLSHIVENNNSLPQQQPPSTTTTSINNNNNLPQQQQPPLSGDSQSCGDILPVSSTQCHLVMAKHAANAEM